MLSWSQIRHGFQLGVEGGIVAVLDPKVRRWFLKTLTVLAVSMVCLYVIVRLLVHGPLAFIRFLNWVSWYIFGHDYLATRQALLNAGASVDWALGNLPLTGVLFVHTVYPKPFDAMFMTVVQTQSPAYYTALVNWPHKAPLWTMLKHHAQRTWKRVRLGCLMLVLMAIPVVGPFLPLAANFKLMMDIVGPGIAAAITAITLAIPGTRDISYPLFKSILACQQLNRELLDPFFTRLKLTPKNRRKWLRERQSLLLGFVVGFYLLIQLPIIGPAFFVIAQAAMGYWVIHTTSLDALAKEVVADPKPVKH